MQKFQPLLLEIWQEACKHIRLVEMLATVAPMLRDDFPLEQIIICRIDSANSCVSTMALGFLDSAGQPASGRAPCSASQLHALQDWWSAEATELFSGGHALPFSLQTITAPYAGRDILLAPVGRPDGLQAILVMIAECGKRLQTRHQELAGLLREPF
ncbi:MAG: hypothetical protein FJ119_14770, partial [Deltaproteobacteria bacterium]|nr:hypothetical protein [Deltaproteobacteria bacterium]